MKTIGSQTRETLAESGYSLIGRIDVNEVILQDSADSGGKPELWTQRDDFAGYVIEIDGIGYEFVRTALMGDLWWAGLGPKPIQLIP